jgi:selenocysteine lyase/cysteine desulfurase
MKSYKHLFSACLKDNPNHFAAHSHHPWPDVTFEAQKQCWIDAAKGLDHKWENVFKNILQPTRKFIADLLGGVSPQQICEGQNTFEILLRVMSSLNWTTYKPVTILTTDSEFYSFSRLAQSLKQNEFIKIEHVPTEPFKTFNDRFLKALKKQHYEMVYLSQVFFNSGFTTSSLFEDLKKNKGEALVIIDGYHATGAIPVDVSKFVDDFYYISGGYKYLTSGEGCCFLYAPPNDSRAPMFTGWYTQLSMLADVEKNGGLKDPNAALKFPSDGQKWAGATFDPTAWYRMKAVADLWHNEGLTPKIIHERVIELQKIFLNELKSLVGFYNDEQSQSFDKKALNLVGFDGFKEWGNFLTFDSAKASEIELTLKTQGYTIDRRGNRLRFGFGIYHDQDDILRLSKTLKSTV